MVKVQRGIYSRQGLGTEVQGDDEVLLKFTKLLGKEHERKGGLCLNTKRGMEKGYD